MSVDYEFPINAIPEFLRKSIVDYCDINRAHLDSIATNILNICGFTLSADYQVEVKRGWVERPNIWSIQIAKSGSGKSHQFDDAIKRVNYKDLKLHEEYKKKLEIYLGYLDLKKGSKKDDESTLRLRNYLHENGVSHLIEKVEEIGDSVLKPDKLNCSIENFTFEGLYKTLENNKNKPLLIKYDEIKGLFNSFNRFTKSDDEEGFLKLFSYSQFKKTRQDEEASAYIKEKTVSLIGTTQKGALFDIFQDNRVENGNVFRFLFVIDGHDDSVNVYKTLDHSTINLDPLEDFYMFCDFYLANFENDGNRKTLKITEDAYRYLSTWRDEMNEKYSMSNYDMDVYDAAMGKMDSYIHRIAIILNRLRLFNEYKNTMNGHVLLNDTITIEDYENSSQLIEYYLNTLFVIMDMVVLKYNKFFKNNEEIEFFKDIPNTFTFNTFRTLHSQMMDVHVKTSEKRLRQFVAAGLVKKNRNNEYYKTI